MAELDLLRLEFKDKIYPSLRDIVGNTDEFYFKDGSKDSDGNYNEIHMIVAPIYLDLEDITEESIFDSDRDIR